MNTVTYVYKLAGICSAVFGHRRTLASKPTLSWPFKWEPSHIWLLHKTDNGGSQRWIACCGRYCCPVNKSHLTSCSLMDCSALASLSFTISERLPEWVACSCPTLCDPMDYTVHGILQARILEWIAVGFSRGSSQPRNQTQVSCIAGRFFTSWATRKLWVYLNLYSLSWWCHPTISSSVAPFSCCPQSLPASGSFPMSQLFTLELHHQHSNEYSGLISFRIDWFDIAVQGLSRVFSSTTDQKHQFFGAQPLVQLSHPYMMTGKTKVLTIWTFVSKVTSGF